VALLIRNEATVWLVVLLQLVQMKTWLGTSMVSEMTAVEVSGEIARTLPATLVTVEAEAPAKAITLRVPKAEESTPR